MLLKWRREVFLPKLDIDQLHPLYARRPTALIEAADLLHPLTLLLMHFTGRIDRTYAAVQFRGSATAAGGKLTSSSKERTGHRISGNVTVMTETI